MKEADIKFGELYAVEIDDVIYCKRVASKVPPEPGKQRSRTYIIGEQHESTEDINDRHYPNTIDASKIMMYWADYERTPQYAAKHMADMEQSLDAQIRKAIQSWWDIASQVIASFTGAKVPNSYVPYTVTGAASVEEMIENIRQINVSIPVGTLLDAQEDDVPIPSTSEIQSLMEMRDEIMADLHRNLVPAKEKELRDAIDNLTGGVAINYEAERAMTSYVDVVREGGVDGPHEILVEIATKEPWSPMLKRLTQEEQFQYLIPHLDFT